MNSSSSSSNPSSSTSQSPLRGPAISSGAESNQPQPSSSSSRLPFRIKVSTVSRPIPLLTIKTTEASNLKKPSKKSLKCELEQMEHAFLDVDEDDPRNDEWTFKSKDHPEKLMDSLNALRHERVLCDIVIKAEDQEFPVHKCVLSAVSNYFKAMFTSNLSESSQDVVTLNGVCPFTLKLLFDFAYTSEVKITKSNVQNLLATSNLLEMLQVRDACCQYLDKHMDENNSLGIQNFAEIHACEELQRKARNYSLKMFTEIMCGEEFVHISQSQLIDLISSDDLECEREEQVFMAVIRWLETNRESRETEFHRVLAHVRLPLMSPYFLHDFVEKSNIFNQSKECQRLVEEAKLYHLLPDRRIGFNTERTRPRINTGLISSLISVGGEDDKVVLRSVEAWNPNTHAWKPLACLPFAISKHGLVVSGHNQMYLAGGEYPDGTASKAFWRFDPRLNIWQEMQPMQTPRSELGLCLLDGFVYAIGGWEGTARLSTVEKYDMENNTWSLVDAMKFAVTSPAVVAHEGFLYVCGGAFLEDGDGIDNVQRFDTRNPGGEWTEMAKMLIPRSGSAACVLNGYIYVIGGWHASSENTNKVEKYDIQKNQWSFVCPMHERRYRPGVAVYNNRIYVMGGEEGWDKYHNTIERYDPERDRWESVGHMPSARSWLACGLLKVKSEILQESS